MKSGQWLKTKMKSSGAVKDHDSCQLEEVHSKRENEAGTVKNSRDRRQTGCSPISAHCFAFLRLGVRLSLGFHEYIPVSFKNLFFLLFPKSNLFYLALTLGHLMAPNFK